MLCPVCNKAQATLRITRYYDDGAVVGVTCEGCYEKTYRLNDRSFRYVFGVLPEKTCPSCGRTYGEFCETLQLGCPQCYKTFEKELVPLISSIQNK